MNRFGKRSLALLLCAGLGASMLTGCGKKAEASPVFTYNGEAVDQKMTTFLFRMQEASFDEVYGNMFAQYYGGGNVWDMDLTGEGETYSETFKEQFKDTVERLMIAQDHAGDYDITLSDEEEKKIGDAADQFISDNSQDVLDAMDGDRDTIVKTLEMQTIQKKVEDKIGETADTEVSDEEAAQKTISYICYTPVTEAESEAETEGTVETEPEAAAETETDVTPAASQAETAVETESSDKTQSADETEAAGETEEAGEAEAAAGAEGETETESAAMQEARERYKAMAEEEFEKVKDSDKDFSEIVDQITQENATGVMASTISFGEDDTYPADEIKDAVKDADDDTLIDHIVEANDNYYIIHVDKAFDQDATDQKKEQIIEERKQTAVDDQYTEWEKDVKFETDEDAFGELKFDRAYTAPQTDAPAETESAGTESAETESAGTGSDLQDSTEVDIEDTTEIEITIPATEAE